MGREGIIKTDANLIFLTISGVFIGCLVCSNLIFQKFFTVNIFSLSLEVSVGIIPYPITFLCTDIISEIYGKTRANQVVVAGFITNIFILGVISIANWVDATSWSPIDDKTFNKVFGLFPPAVIASLLAYLVAQFVDIRLFHFWKDLTRGRYLWVRNNFSTIFSQIIDTCLLLGVLCFFGVVSWDRVGDLFTNSLIYKILFALADTPFFYLSVWLLNPQFFREK
ncbi:MAG TPA: queuosine precursor transporter [Geminocystis sp. M7585_C2015_104]|nr:queuosine precursor transporter [Geminocystis sp. M7585_C2015_104]